MDPLSLDFEAVLDTPTDGGGAEPVEPAGAEVAEPVEAAPEPDLLTRAEVQELLDQREAEILHRVQAGQQPAAPTQQQQGDQPDWREMMNPLSDDYDPERFYAARDEYLLTQFESRLDQRLAPLTAREQTAQQQAGQEYVNQFVDARWQDTTDGPLTKEARDGINALIPGYLAEANSRYGETDIAAREALTKATETIRAINRAARQAGSQANIDGLATLAAAAGEPGTNGAAHNAPPPAKSPLELLQRRFGSP